MTETNQTSNETIEEMIEWINTLGVSLWGKFFATQSIDDRRKAAEWFLKQVTLFEAWQEDKNHTL